MNWINKCMTYLSAHTFRKYHKPCTCSLSILEFWKIWTGEQKYRLRSLVLRTSDTCCVDKGINYYHDITGSRIFLSGKSEIRRRRGSGKYSIMKQCEFESNGGGKGTDNAIVTANDIISYNRGIKRTITEKYDTASGKGLFINGNSSKRASYKNSFTDSNDLVSVFMKNQSLDKGQ